MRNAVLWIVAVGIIVITACQKSGLNDNPGIDTKSYETKLSADYRSALADQNSLATSQAPTDIQYYNMMFERHDSLFSQHFFNFCSDFLKSSGTQYEYHDTSHHGGMGDGGMMNGGMMDDHHDYHGMVSYMDSLHLSSEHSGTDDFLLTDSLMYREMETHSMIPVDNDTITHIYHQMQDLRRIHRAFNGI